MIIDQLPLLATAQATDEIPIERGVTTYKTALSTMLDVAKSNATSPADGTAAIGTSDRFARQDHKHPLNVATSGTPVMDGTASLGSATDYARTDHVHPTDTSRQEALVSGTNIKTINNNSLLGSGDITIGAVDSVNGQTGTVVLDAADVGAVSIDVAWENASPASSFAPQTVALSKSYSYLIVEICASINDNGAYLNMKGFAFIKQGETVNINSQLVLLNTSVSSNSYVYARECTFFGTSVTFGDGFAKTTASTSASSQSSNYAVPQRIYGFI